GERIIIVSGLSGAGKSVALRALEDSGFFCIDNLPLSLIGSALFAIGTGENKKICISADIRGKGLMSSLFPAITHLKKTFDVELLFLVAEKEVIVRRYKETRRPHPMIPLEGRKMDMEKAIDEEIRILSVMKESADRVIDTSEYSPHQLRQLIISIYGNYSDMPGMNVSVVSFGFKYGPPKNMDMILDVRFLPNPYFVPELSPLKGTDEAVSTFVLSHDTTQGFLSHVYSLIDFILPHYIREGRAYLSLGIGCTGGRHRSPAIATEISRHLLERHSLIPITIHRDME
ncbi:MAG: RNase adapter RapZ, partial [Nitrospirales bacterium]|nr:RNase adapter RapZ [Nitrospirales bacterium]